MNWGEIGISASGGTPPYTFRWNEGRTSTYIAHFNDGFHAATVTDVNGCKDTISVTTTCVEQGSIIKVPQAFTPNGDGVNDYLPVFADAGIIADFQFSIFNRWGNVVFSTSEMDILSTGETTKGWDGSWKGAPQEMGVYVYHLTVAFVNGKKAMLNGNVTLIR